MGEIAYRGGEHDAAFARLRAAILLEDDLPYDESWGWMQPMRHALGALLLEQERAAEAEAPYREDLGLGGALPRAQIHPDNPWALRGLLDCPERRGETTKAALIRQGLASPPHAPTYRCRCPASAPAAMPIEWPAARRPFVEHHADRSILRGRELMPRHARGCRRGWRGVARGSHGFDLYAD